jgi:uncharacterized protein YciI
MKQTFAIFREPGAAWLEGKTSREQPSWNEHAAFMDNLFEQGVIVLGGPYADYSGVLLIVEVENEDAAGHLFDDDPWTIHDILRKGMVKPWLIFLDGRQK